MQVQVMLKQHQRYDQRQQSLLLVTISRSSPCLLRLPGMPACPMRRHRGRRAYGVSYGKWLVTSQANIPVPLRWAMPCSSSTFTRNMPDDGESHPLDGTQTTETSHDTSRMRLRANR
jgi:hypothetical protein